MKASQEGEAYSSSQLYFSMSYNKDYITISSRDLPSSSCGPSTAVLITRIVWGTSETSTEYGQISGCSPPPSLSISCSQESAAKGLLKKDVRKSNHSNQLFPQKSNAWMASTIWFSPL